jgi:hypothetical protein
MICDESSFSSVPNYRNGINCSGAIAGARGLGGMYQDHLIRGG